METTSYAEGIEWSGHGGTRRVIFKRLLWVVPVAGLAAATINAALFLGASAFGAISEAVVVQGRGGITLGAVVSISFVPALVAGVILMLFGRFTRRPVRNFVALAVVVLVLSFATPFSLVGAAVAMRAALLLMHAVAAVIIVGVLITLATRKE